MSDPGPTPGTVAVLLAAGSGSRFDGPFHKLLADLDGTPIAERSIDAVVRSGVGPVVVVCGAVDLTPLVERVRERIGERSSDAPLPSTTVVHHPGWADGQATSLQAGLAAAIELGATAIVVGLADMPFVDADTWRRVAASTAPIAVATYDGRRRNPVRLAAEVWPELPTTGDEGARSLFRRSPDRVEEVPCSGSPDDIDTQEDLASWQSRSSTSSPSISRSTRPGR
jgi:CTP:molybdopterin cytidylyltransferase MocA